METTFLVIFTFLFLVFQTYGTSSSNTMITTSSNVTCIQRERQSLLAFKQGLTKESNRLSTWTGVECREWRGVGCDRRNGHVVKLDLRSSSSNWIEGKVSPSLLNLKHLRHLDLSMNNFSGQNIPEFFGAFKYLEYLNLSYSGFSGVVPPHLGNLSRLQYLDLNQLDKFSMMNFTYEASLMVKDDLRWVSLLTFLKHLDFSGITIGIHNDWFHPVNKLPSLLTLNLAGCDINIPSTKFINFTSLNSLDLSFNSINTTVPVWLSNLTDLVHLDLSNNSFHGGIPDSIGTLSSLSYMDLGKNQLSGPIPPSLGGLSSLTGLYLNDNQLSESIPESIGLLTRLQDLWLYSNQLSGSIPTSVGQLSNLEILYLDGNRLSGNIPTSVGQLSNLQDLQLSDNRLSGNIPTSVGQLSNLEVLYLHSNRLSGNIPTSVGQLSNLENLALHNNSLSGVVSEIHFTKLINLTHVWLSDNPSLSLNVSPHWIPPFQLEYFWSCNMGPQFPKWLQTQTGLESLHLSKSGIRDRIPEWFQNISSHLRFLDLSDNQIHGNLPRIIRNNTGLQLYDLRNNRFTGSVPTHLCKLHNTRLLDLSHNKIFGILPNCIESLIQLRIMDLTSNNITGDIPNSLGSLSQLESLHLSNNKFEGNLPVSLQNLTSLVTMDLGNNLLTGNIPFWIGKRLSKLRILNLQSNMFTGNIPPKLCQIKTLQHLNLANNRITGSVPHCFSNITGMIKRDVESFQYEENIEACIKGSQRTYTSTLKYLISLDLSSNKIIGEIPSVLMNLKALTNLNLSRNVLSGHIPTTIGNLMSMESLDLSWNKLSGRIPPSLANLNSLGYFNLSFNELSGPLPVGNHIQTFDDPTIYEGNNGLCGFPVLRSCKGNNLPFPAFPHVADDEGENGSKGFSWVYAGMVPGFVVGFMGLIASFHYIKIWRVIYFEMIENVYAFLTVPFIVIFARLRRKFF